MTGLTDIRDRALTMLRALGVEPDAKQMRTVEKYARWGDGQVPAAHIDGRDMDREVAGGHEIVVTHTRFPGGPEYVAHCNEPEGADCRLTCEDGCEEWDGIDRDLNGVAYHLVPAGDGAVSPHGMVDSGECQVVLWLNEAAVPLEELSVESRSEFEVGRFRIKPVWTGSGVEWERMP